MAHNLGNLLLLVKIGVCHDSFFSSRRRHTRFDCDWSSDVCSSDLISILEGSMFTRMTKLAVIAGGLLLAGAPLAAQTCGEWLWANPAPQGNLLSAVAYEIGRASRRERV